jgi:hypothetical protein
MKAIKTFEAITAEECAQIDKQINSDSMSQSKEKTMRQLINR